MQKIYFFVQLALCFCVFPVFTSGQVCTGLTASFTAYESRCAATGSIRIIASGGSGSYKYKTLGPVNSNFTTSDSITGLSAGVYTVVVNDIVRNCTFTRTGIVVPGTYSDPRFTLNPVHVSCDNGSNGSITVTGQQFGRYPFTYSIVAPSPAGVGSTNTTGVFENLPAGDYNIRLTDSCGGIQTRSLTINNYSWWIDAFSFTKISCTEATGFIKVVDSRGNISTVGGIPNFTYGVVRAAGDTIWSTNPAFTFQLAGASSFDIIAKDGCGKIKKGNTVVKFTPFVGANTNIYNTSCSSFSVALADLTNFFNADFCLYDNNGIQVNCNSTGIFNNLAYGRYCIKAHNQCPDTTIIRCINVLPPPLSVGSAVTITNKNCNSFSAAINGQTGLTNPEYCLYDGANVLIGCNSTGVFSNLNYGNYCIFTKDNCRDTTISRCFSIRQPVPQVPQTVTPGYMTCTNFGIRVGGDSLFRPRFCLYDSSGTMLSCNSTGIFDSLSYGNYCVNTYDSCYDTTIVRCFGVGRPVLTNNLTAIFTNKTCSTFSIRGSAANIQQPKFCLYNASNVELGCNNSGIFLNVAYGTYCLKVISACPDTSFTTCFTATPPLPTIATKITVTNKACSTFTAKVTGQQNLTNPQYCIYDSHNVQVSCNTTGTFNNLAYGNYCIRVVNSCYDSTIERCFVGTGVPIDINVTASKSCTYGYATMGITSTGGTLPINIKIYRPDSSLLMNKNFSSTSFNIDSIPGAAVGLTYKIVATDNCGNKDSANVDVTASVATHVPLVYAQCPSAIWQQGSGRIEIATATNIGVFTVRIIKKNNVTLAQQLVPDVVIGSQFKYNDLGAGTYIISYKLNDLCNKYFYDTVVIAPYVYPNLSRSSAYQCDVNGFSVGAVASNGVGPFSYEIIGSTPLSPSIITAPQSNPVFNINNSSNYSLIRLRALDACGNATLADASILPLANYKIDVDSNCFQSSSTLSVDTIYNSTYKWYKKENYNSTDSIYLGTGYSYHIPFLSASDTGIYLCHITVNTGCVKRSYKYNLTGMCYSVLPVSITGFSGRLVKEKVALQWETSNEADMAWYVVERKVEGDFIEIGKVAAKGTAGSSSYDFTDPMPASGQNYYRLTMVNKKNAYTHSNIVVLTKKLSGTEVRVYPNPVTDGFTVTVDGPPKHIYKLTLLNMVSQVVAETTLDTDIGNNFRISRNSSMGKGIYLLKCTDLITREKFIRRVVFL